MKVIHKLQEPLCHSQQVTATCWKKTLILVSGFRMNSEQLLQKREKYTYMCLSNFLSLPYSISRNIFWLDFGLDPCCASSRRATAALMSSVSREPSHLLWSWLSRRLPNPLCNRQQLPPAVFPFWRAHTHTRGRPRRCCCAAGMQHLRLFAGSLLSPFDLFYQSTNKQHSHRHTHTGGRTGLWQCSFCLPLVHVFHSHPWILKHPSLFFSLCLQEKKMFFCVYQRFILLPCWKKRLCFTSRCETFSFLHNSLLIFPFLEKHKTFKRSCDLLI